MFVKIILILLVCRYKSLKYQYELTFILDCKIS